MLNIKGLDHINVNVYNLDETVKWYKEIFGFEVKEEGEGLNSSPYKIIGKSGVLYMAIYENETECNKDSTLNHIGLNLTNFDESIETLRAKGIEFGYGGEVINYENSKSVYITDPNGIEIELSSHFGGGLN